jgi:ribosomal 30S subunit maturation factor RimM
LAQGESTQGESALAEPDRNWLPLGTVGRPYGVRGAFHVRLYNPESLAFETLSHVELVRQELGQRTSSQSFEIVEASPRPKGLVMALRGLDSPEAAARWTGAEIRARRSDLPPLAPGEYYLVDLIGCEVWAPASPADETADETSQPDGQRGETSPADETSQLGEWRQLGEVSAVRSDPSCDTAVVRRSDGTLVEFAVVPAWIANVDVDGRRIELSSEEGLIEP